MGLIKRRSRLRVSDSFNRADSTTMLGSADTGQAWTAVVGTWGISSNQAYQVTTTNNAFAVVESGLSDVDVQVTFAQKDGELGLYIRSVDINNWVRVVRSGTALYLQKKVAGAQSTINSVSGLTFANGDTVRVVVSGGNYTIYHNGVQRLTATDAAFATATTHGIGVATAFAGVRWDNFKVEAA